VKFHAGRSCGEKGGNVIANLGPGRPFAKVKAPTASDFNTLKIGESLSREGRYRDALAFFERALESNRDCGPLHYRVGCVYLKLCNWKAAASSLEKALALGAPEIPVSCARARVLLANQKTDACLSLCEDILRADSRCAEAWAITALAHVSALRHAEAAEAARRGLALGRTAELLAIMGFLALRTGPAEDCEAFLDEALALDPGLVEAHVYKAQLLMARKDVSGARDALAQALRLNPWCDIAYGARARLAEAAGDFESAGGDYGTALWINPQNARIHANAGRMYESRAQYALALAHYRRAQLLQPAAAAYALGVARLYSIMSDEVRAGEWFRKALAMDPGNPNTLYNLAIFHLKRDDADEAMRAVDAMLANDGGDYLAKKLKSEILIALGRKEEALAWLESAMADNPSCVELFYNYAVLSRKKAAAKIDRIKEWAGCGDLGARELMYANFALAKAHEGLGEYGPSFAAYVRGNGYRAKCLGQSYDHGAYVKGFDRLKSLFGREYFEKCGRLDDTGGEFVFIVGMPRSGSTLLEQILSSADGVQGVGEKETLADLERRFLAGSSLEAAARFDPGALALLGPLRKVARELYRVEPGALRVVDKRLLNYSNLWFAKLLFPKARILRALRDPMATCLSCFTNNFILGHDYKNRMEDLAAFYVLYDDLMRHWAEAIGGDLFTVRYERLVEDPETVSREAFAHVGLPWSGDCLNFQNAKQVVKTASALQVRQGIFKTSLDYWRNFEKDLLPMAEYFKERLAPMDGRIGG